MAYTNEGLKFNATAEAAILAYVFVMGGTADSKVLTATAGAKILGINEDVAAINKATGITHQGQSKVILGGNVTRFQKIKADSSGYGVYADTNKDEYGAVALASGVSGDIIPVLIEKGMANI